MQFMIISKINNFISQTSIRYNHVLHGDHANSKPLPSLAKREDARASFYKMASC